VPFLHRRGLAQSAAVVTRADPAHSEHERALEGPLTREHMLRNPQLVAGSQLEPPRPQAPGALLVAGPVPLRVR
jgi:hypothetical protein